MLTGTAMSSERADDTAVPYMNGSAPNSSCTGFQARFHKKLAPNFSNERVELSAISRMIRRTSPAISRAKTSVVILNSRSPLRPPPRSQESGAGKKRRAPTVEGSLSVMIDFIEESALAVRKKRLALMRDRLDPGFGFRDDLCRKGRVAHLGSHLLPVVNGPPEEIYEGLAFYGVLLLFVNEQVGEGRYRVGIGAGRVCDRYPQIAGHPARDARRRRRDRLERGINEAARRVLERRDRQPLLLRVDQLHVAYGIRSLLDLSRHSFVALGPERIAAGRPLDRGPRPGLLFPRRAHFAQVIREDVTGPAPVRAMHARDGVCGQAQARVL